MWVVYTHFFMKGDTLIQEKIILWDTKYGEVKCHLKDIMNKKRITISQLARLTNIRYEVVDNYYNNRNIRYDSVVLAKFCYTLDCSIDDLLKYEV